MTETQLEVATAPEELYLDLLMKCLTRYVFEERYRPIEPERDSIRRLVYAPIERALSSRDLALVRRARFDPAARAIGKDWPAEAETMIGLKRLENLRYCISDVLRNKVPGDLIETGVWRGGASIFMRGVLKAYGVADRAVWAADSFQGLPRSDEPGSHPSDRGHRLWAASRLGVPVEEVKANFARYGLLDDQVRFLVGWFRDSLPDAPIKRLAVARLDGDLYESTMDALRPLYPKLSVGGYLIVDDYGDIDACRQAVHDYRSEQGIGEEIQWVDDNCVFWRRQG